MPRRGNNSSSSAATASVLSSSWRSLLGSARETENTPPPTPPHTLLFRRQPQEVKAGQTLPTNPTWSCKSWTRTCLLAQHVHQLLPCHPCNGEALLQHSRRFRRSRLRCHRIAPGLGAPQHAECPLTLSDCSARKPTAPGAPFVT